jgi:excisionase family DNA binding protein
VKTLLSKNGITLEAVIDALAERIATKMEAGNRFGASNPGKRLLTTEEAAEFLGRTKEAMQHLAISGKIPTVRSDRRVFFDIHDLERWISQNKEAGLN